MTADAQGGVWTWALELARGLAPHGVDIALAVLGGEPSAAQREEAAQVPNLKVHASEFKLEWMDNPWSDLEASREWLAQIESVFKPHIVHLNSYGHSSMAWNSPVVLTAHSCVDSWWRAARGSEPPAEWDQYRQLVSTAVATADLLVTPTLAMQQALETSYGTLAPERRVIWNGRNPDTFSPAEKEDFVLSAGRLWDEAKNIGKLVSIAPNLPWKVVVAGPTTGPNGEAAMVEGAQWIGYLSTRELARWYGRAAIYALPARYEPFGLTVLEAALSECALVLGDIASLREVWGDTAIYVPPDDAGALEAALRRLIDDPESRRQLAQRGRERAVSLTGERMANQYFDAYRFALEHWRQHCTS